MSVKEISSTICFSKFVWVGDGLHNNIVGGLPALLVDFSFLKEWKGALTHSIRVDDTGFDNVYHKTHFKGWILAFMSTFPPMDGCELCFSYVLLI